jgi:hypothetical protein
MIDSGASVSVMTSNSAHEYGIDETKLKQVDHGGDSNFSVHKYPFQKLDLAGLVIINPEIVILPERNAALHNIQNPKPIVVLGVTALRQLHIYIAYREKVLYLTPTDSH